MVKFVRRIQELNRVAIPQEIIKEHKLKIGDYVEIESQLDYIIIKKR